MGQIWLSDLLLNVKVLIPSTVSWLHYQISVEAAQALQLDEVHGELQGQVVNLYYQDMSQWIVIDWIYFFTCNLKSIVNIIEKVLWIKVII